MKTIHFIRHAKSSWKNPEIADIDRPLNKRGIRTAPLMAEQFLDAGCCFKHVFCSPAKRAQDTIQLIQKRLHVIPISWTTDSKLYCFDSNQLINWCEHLDNDLSEVLVIGHNPALTDLTNKLTCANLENIPTCGYVRLVGLKLNDWKDIRNSSFKLISFLQPKKILDVEVEEI